MFKVPNQYRIDRVDISTYGNAGAFIYPLSARTQLQIVASNEGEWEHVSVVSFVKGKMTTPTWAQMCKVKDLFWDDEDCVMQLHPPKSDYVNLHPHCLHLWRKIDDNGDIPEMYE